MHAYSEKALRIITSKERPEKERKRDPRQNNIIKIKAGGIEDDSDTASVGDGEGWQVSIECGKSVT